MPYWVEFEDGTSGSVGLRPLIEQATGKKMKQVWEIPEYAAPIIVGDEGSIPFCSDPKGACKFKHSCPKQYRVCND